MIKANIEAAIEAKQNEISKNYEEIKKIDKLIHNLKMQKYKLLDLDTELCYALKELEDELDV